MFNHPKWGTVCHCADKNVATFIQNTSDHKQEILRQLLDTTAYEPDVHDPTNEIIKEIKIILKEG